MGEMESMEDAVRQLTEADPAYAEDAYYLVRDTVTYALEKQEVHRHLNAGELVDALIEYADREYGPLASQVLAEWGVTGPADVGRLVYKLIGAGILSASPEDRPEDFLVLSNWFPPEPAPFEPPHLQLPRIDA